MTWLVRGSARTRFAVAMMMMAAGVAATVAAGMSQAAPPDDVEVTGELQRLVNAYFQAPQQDDRDALVPSIEQAARHDAFAVAKALSRVHAWSGAPDGPVSIFFPEPGRPTAAGVYEVPYRYTSDIAHPMIVMVAPTGFAPEVMLARARLYLGDHVNEFVVVATTAERVGTFHRAEGAKPQLDSLLKRMRQLVHVDTDRVYVLGIREGAEAAWFAGMMHPDLFAGVIAINGYPKTPYPKQMYPLLLENLRHIPVLSIWNRPAPGVGNPKEPVNDVVVHNRLIRDIAKELSLPIKSIELKSTSPANQMPPKDEISQIVTLDRATSPTAIAHWFRYPDQGTSHWLRQQRFAGDPWEAAALSIATRPGVDHDAYVSAVLRDKLAYVGGLVDGQNVTITVRRTSDVEIMLPLGMLDPALPVTVTCNGRTRHTGKLPPSIETMLEDAYNRWEFQAPAAVRLSLSVRSGY